MTSARPRIDEPTSIFIQGAVSIIAAASDRQNLPTLVRAVGCRVSEDRRRVAVLVPASDPLVDAVRATSTIAVTFSRAGTHETIQIKSRNAEPAPPRSDDSELMRRYVEAFLADVCPLGYSEELIRALLWCDPAAVSAISFSPDAAFLQTPGPRAGEPLIC